MTIRVSADDYELLAKSSVSAGTRSVSEFVRVAAFERVQVLGAPRIGLSGDLATLGKSLGELDATIRELGKKIRRVLGPVHTDQRSGSADPESRGE